MNNEVHRSTITEKLRSARLNSVYETQGSTEVANDEHKEAFYDKL